MRKNIFLVFTAVFSSPPPLSISLSQAMEVVSLWRALATLTKGMWVARETISWSQ